MNEELERRADVVGIVPKDALIARPVGAGLFKQNDAWQTASRYIEVEAFAKIDQEETDPIPSIETART